MENGKSNISRLPFFGLLIEARRMASIMSFGSPLKGIPRVDINSDGLIMFSDASTANAYKLNQFGSASLHSFPFK